MISYSVFGILATCGFVLGFNPKVITLVISVISGAIGAKRHTIRQVTYITAFAISFSATLYIFMRLAVYVIESNIQHYTSIALMSGLLIIGAGIYNISRPLWQQELFKQTPGRIYKYTSLRHSITSSALCGMYAIITSPTTIIIPMLGAVLCITSTSINLNGALILFISTLFLPSLLIAILLFAKVKASALMKWKNDSALNFFVWIGVATVVLGWSALLTTSIVLAVRA